MRIYDAVFGDRDPVSSPGTSTGSPGNWFTVFALAPDILEHNMEGVLLLAGRRRKLSPHLRELAIARCGWVRGSIFMYSQHSKGCRGAGVAEDKIQGISAWAVMTCYTRQERAVLAYTDCLLSHDGRVPDALFTELAEVLTDVEILELSYAVGQYGMYATIARALRLEYDDVDDLVYEVDGDERMARDLIGRDLQPEAKRQPVDGDQAADRPADA